MIKKWNVILTTGANNDGTHHRIGFLDKYNTGYSTSEFKHSKKQMIEALDLFRKSDDGKKVILKGNTYIFSKKSFTDFNMLIKHLEGLFDKKA